jgi:uncharacterized protein YaeQ
MALKATIYKAELSIADLDRNYYAEHNLTLARHPSETDERMMVRLLAFALFADEALTFGKGLCVDDEPDLWQRDLTGAVDRWIDVGQPDEKWIRKASGRSGEVVIVSFGRAADTWWSGIRSKLTRLTNLRVLNLAPDTAPALAALTERGMRLQCTIQDGQVWVTNGQETVLVEPVTLVG